LQLSGKRLENLKVAVRYLFLTACKNTIEFFLDKNVHLKISMLIAKSLEIEPLLIQQQ
jgi:hypothetical protein